MTTTTPLHSAAQLTVVFLAMYGATFINILIAKRSNAKQFGQKFDRYTSVSMRPADRLQGNFLEWSPMFLGLVWSLAVSCLKNDNVKVSFTAAWVYLGFRALYMVLVLRHGFNARGLNKHLWVSTFPAYGCLVWILQQCCWNLFLV